MIAWNILFFIFVTLNLDIGFTPYHWLRPELHMELFENNFTILWNVIIKTEELWGDILPGRKYGVEKFGRIPWSTLLKLTTKTYCCCRKAWVATYYFLVAGLVFALLPCILFALGGNFSLFCRKLAMGVTLSKAWANFRALTCHNMQATKAALRRAMPAYLKVTCQAAKVPAPKTSPQSQP